MERMEEMDWDEFQTPEAKLALELAREDQNLITSLIARRKEKGLSQEQLAELIGIAQATVSAFERVGNDPHLSTVRRYARALGVMVRHHLDDDAECGDSQYIAHVSDRGVTTQETAAAIYRGLRPAEAPHWAVTELDDYSWDRTHLVSRSEEHVQISVRLGGRR